MNLADLRRYRLDLENYPYYNDKSVGIALFDLIVSFIGAYILEKWLDLSTRLPLCKKNKRIVYYLLVIPFGIIVHHIIAHLAKLKRSFNEGHLRSKKIFPNEITYLNKKIISLQPNIYQFLLMILIIYIVNKCKQL